MDKTSTQWLRFVEGLPPDGPLRPVILESWERSKAAAVDPKQTQPAFRQVTAGDLRRRLAENADWLAIARSHLDWLHATLSQFPHAGYLTDREGIVLHSVGTRSIIESCGLAPGFDWSEAQMGTNGAGTALAGKQPIAVVGAEHFIGKFSDCTCTAAPIFAPDGTVIGAIDITSAAVDGNPERLALVAHMAYVIGRELALDRKEASLRQAHRSSQESEQQLRCALNAARMVSWDWNLASDEVRRSDNAASIFGLQSGPSEEFRRMIHPEDRERVEAAYAAAREGRADCNLEFRVVRSDGRTMPVLASASLRIDPLTKQPHLSGVCMDLTDRKRSEALFRASQEASLFGFTILNSVRGDDGQIEDFEWEYVNPAAAAIIKRPAEELIGKRMLDVLPNSRKKSDLFERYCRVVETGKPHDYELRYEGEGIEGWFRNVTVKLEDGVAVSFTDMTARKQAELKLRESEKNFRHMANTAPVVIWVTDRKGRCTFINEHWSRLSGQRADQALGFGWTKRIHPDDRQPARAQFLAANEAGTDYFLEYRFMDPTGNYRWAIAAGRPRLRPDGKFDEYIGCVLDITDHRLLQERLRQSQKMEAFGQLAGGVAHDFNNLLTIISGNSETLSELLASDDTRQEFVQEISKAGRRAASLTQQLLAFSRQTMLAPKVLNLNAIVTETEKMLRRLIGEDIRLAMQLDSKLRLMKLDPGQCEQILINLAVNARDAMPKGGELTIETANITIEKAGAATDAEVKVGDYVSMTVKDTGTGMTREVKERLFEPYFTTKKVGKGTGLGLAVVHGIVKQNGGHIDVASVPGKGSTFRLYFPAVQGPIPSGKQEGNAKASQGTESLLLVEDEDAVRRLLLRILQNQGYEVLVASNGSEALTLMEDHHEPIELLVTDVVMPEIGGPALAQSLSLRYPDMKVLFLSGHTDDAIVRHGLVQDDVAFLQKPFSPLTLAKKVREVLDMV